MQIHVPEHIELINQKLGGNCFLVGGCVRDSILKREINDYDITSANLPEDIMAMSCDEFQVNPVGIDFGVVQIVVPGCSPVEHATFRSDGEYSDFRRPDSVSYSSDILDDLIRRDFTMNALAYNITTREIIDPQMGQLSIEQKEIRFVGNGVSRVIEDPLRILRAIRFVSQLGFDIDYHSILAISAYKDLIKTIAKERITVEWFKLCRGQYASKAIDIMVETGIIDILFPELIPGRDIVQNKYHRLNVFEHNIATFKALQEIIRSDKVISVAETFGVDWDNDIAILLTAALLHDCGKALTKSTDEQGNIHFYDHETVGAEMVRTTNQLCLSAREKKTLLSIIELHMCLHRLNSIETPRRRSITKFLKTMGDLVPHIYAHTVADLMASRKISDAKNNFAQIPIISEVLNVYTGAYNVYKQNPLITGDDLIRLGYVPGKEFGMILDDVSDRFSNGEIETFEEAVSWVLNNYA